MAAAAAALTLARSSPVSSSTMTRLLLSMTSEAEQLGQSTRFMPEGGDTVMTCGRYRAGSLEQFKGCCPCMVLMLMLLVVTRASGAEGKIIAAENQRTFTKYACF